MSKEETDTKTRWCHFKKGFLKKLESPAENKGLLDQTRTKKMVPDQRHIKVRHTKLIYKLHPIEFDVLDYTIKKTVSEIKLKVHLR